MSDSFNVPVKIALGREYVDASCGFRELGNTNIHSTNTVRQRMITQCGMSTLANYEDASNAYRQRDAQRFQEHPRKDITAVHRAVPTFASRP